MRKANKSIFQKLCLISAVSSALLLTGCMGGGSSNSSSSDNPPFSRNENFYDSSKSSSSNLASMGSQFSAYNGASALRINDVPVDTSSDVLYACLITNPNSSSIKELTLQPPLAYNARASKSDEANEASDNPLPANVVEFRENPSAKLQLQQELLQIYNSQEASNARCSVRAAVSHKDEYEGQKGIEISVLSKKRTCTLVKVSKYAKIFVDTNGDGGVAAGNIPANKLNEFAEEFDNYIYPVMKENFGDDEGSDIFWNDVDNDAHLSIVFSPIVNNYQSNVTGIFDSASINSRNPRDMVSLSVMNDNNSKGGFDKWFMDARETIAHEMQHIINFSAKGNRSEYELWIDEGLSVCAEILYRIRRSNLQLSTYSLYYNGIHADFPGNDARFYCYAYLLPEVAVESFGKTVTDTDTELLAHYGQKGLFFYYLYEQYGKDIIRKLCRGASGRGKFSYLISDRSLEQLIIDFNLAILYEKLRNVNFSKFPTNPYLTAKKAHRYETNMALKFKQSNSGDYYEITEKDINFLNLATMRDKLTIISPKNFAIGGNGGTVRILLLQPKGMEQPNFLGRNSYSFTLSSDGKPFVVNMFRMNK